MPSGPPSATSKCHLGQPLKYPIEQHQCAICHGRSTFPSWDGRKISWICSRLLQLVCCDQFNFIDDWWHEKQPTWTWCLGFKLRFCLKNADRSMKQIYASEINELTYHLRVMITLGSPTCIFLFQLCGFYTVSCADHNPNTKPVLFVEYQFWLVISRILAMIPLNS